MKNGTTDKLIRAARRGGVNRSAAILAACGLLAGIASGPGCGGGGGGGTTPITGPTAPGLPTTATSGDFNDLVVRLDVVSGGYKITKLASYATSVDYTTFGTYVPGNPTAQTQIWLDSVPNGTTANVTSSASSPIGFYIDNTAPMAIQDGTAGTWYTQPSLNSDGYSHCDVLQRGSTIFYLCWVDAKLPRDDQNTGEPQLKQILAADGATYNGNTVLVSTQTF